MNPGAAGLLRCALIVLSVLAGSVSAQAASVRVYSEFSRIDPFGKIVSADRPRGAEARPREILSPGLARNAYASFHIAVTVAPGAAFTLHVGQNPEGSFHVTVYREVFQRRGGEWIPDGLEAVKLPYTARLPDRARPVVGQTTVTFLMDVWIPAEAEVQRIKLQPQVYTGGLWLTYPMEVRVLSAVIPGSKTSGPSLGGVEQPSDSTARGALRAYLCGAPAGDFAARGNVRWRILRNAVQDTALARSLEPRPGARLLAEILRLTKNGEPEQWCETPRFPEELGPEWYLRVRDALYRMAP